MTAPRRIGYGARTAIVGIGAIAALLLAGVAAGAPQLEVGGSVLNGGFLKLGKSIQKVANRIQKITVPSQKVVAPRPKPHEISPWVNVADYTALALILAAIVYFFLIPALRQVDWSHFWVVSGPEAPDEDDAALLTPEALERLRRDLDESVDLLDEDGDPRHAVLATWRRLEEAVGRTGLARSASETSSEFTARVLGTYTVDGGQLESLHRLYRSARYSTAQVSESARVEAHVRASTSPERRDERPTETSRDRWS